ncbi:hypothetical protein ACERK3_14250 [Phycisphaerales bacterium AB-hyl4]|uniref:Outer membrane protein n=1 Tax=Natronomicrosphaera hydrolytica TaxID=3242702 RepID=A0ABV4U772_9BACT
MHRIQGRGHIAAAAALATAITGGAAATAVAQDDPGIAVPDGLRVSGALGTEVSSHFISYGTDVWGAGSSWSRPSVFAFSEVSIDFDYFDVTTGVWFDIRESDRGPLGGPINEVDWYLGIGKNIDRFRVDLVYQAWFYTDEGTEEVFDVVLGFDDSDLLFEGFAFNPSLIAHTRLHGPDPDFTGGTVFVFGIEPEYTVMPDGDFPVTFSLPAEVAFGIDGFYADNGFGYAALGVSAGMPLTFIPADYGSWSLGANLTYYWTDADAIGNPRSDFLTGLVGLYLDF